IAMAPILVPSLLPGIALIYLFGNQGMIRDVLFGASIYGPLGIVVGSVFFTFPHALIIISTALAISDQRHYEAAASLRASRWRTFWTVTIPGARYGLISAAFVVFTLAIT
ncbi:ABC transporter permease subunit, partial [Providencia rettgeri]|uniref:ABC transporter permease subunit n=2 Tax=Pseudomonadota TaxID=1224 RepID=UPI0029D4511E